MVWDTYSIILSLKRFFLELSPLGLKYYSTILVFTLKILHLSLKINLRIAFLLLEQDRIRLEYIGNISKLDRTTLFDRSELNNSLKIRDQFRKLHSRKKINDLCYLEDFCHQFRFQINKLYIKNIYII